MNKKAANRLGTPQSSVDSLICIRTTVCVTNIQILNDRQASSKYNPDHNLYRFGYYLLPMRKHTGGDRGIYLYVGIIIQGGESGFCLAG